MVSRLSAYLHNWQRDNTDIRVVGFGRDEHGYRRGYVHGVSATMEAIGHLLPEPAQAKLNIWVSRELRLWEMDQSDFKPPALPSME